MAIRIVRLGTPRSANEGLRIGTVRKPPRGVRKKDYAARDYFDVWLPDIAPSTELLGLALSAPLTGQHWTKFASRYRREMQEPGQQRMLELLARLSHQTNFSVGCYCEHEDRCHRSILRELLIKHGAEIALDRKQKSSEGGKNTSKRRRTAYAEKVK